MKAIEKEYSNGEVTVIWKPHKCIHSEKCYKGLPHVFKPKEKPWIQPENEDSETIAQQVEKCPSGALQYYYNKEGKPDKTQEDMENQDTTKVETMKNGPLMVYGKVKLSHGDEQKELEKVTAFCRCGASGNKPFCDGSHEKVDFKG
jgi:uncharacterized Fe-S cluster protein YjdI